MESQNKWWNNPSCSLESFNVCSLFNGTFSKDSSECCDQCKNRFTLLKRKKLCEKCGLIYCKSCLFSLGQNKVCKKCKIFTLWPADKSIVGSLRVRDLMYYLQTNRIPTNTCKEKNDLVELVIVHLNFKHYRQQPTRSDTSNVSQTTIEPISPLVNPTRAVDPQQSGSYNDEGIRVYSMAETEEDNSSLSAWCILENPIVEGTIPDDISPSPTEQTSNITQFAKNNEVLRAVNCNNSAEVGDEAITSNETSPSATQQRDEPATDDAQATEESSNNEVPSIEEPANAAQHIYPGIDVINECASGLTSILELPQTKSSNSTPQHLKGSQIDVTSIIKLSSLTDENSIRTLSVRQCKEILSLHRVDFTGVMEKHELVSKLILLWKDFKERYSDLSSVPEDQICKICMDAPIDCVFLNCGHVISCIFCGKQMAECPICRQNVVRVVRIFKT